MFGAFVGAFFGVGMRAWANKLGKQHTLARPWNYVGVVLVGGYVGHNYKRWENNMLEAVNEKRVAKGYKPISAREVVGF